MKISTTDTTIFQTRLRYFATRLQYFVSNNQASTESSESPSDISFPSIKPPPNFSNRLPIFCFQQSTHHRIFSCAFWNFNSATQASPNFFEHISVNSFSPIKLHQIFQITFNILFPPIKPPLNFPMCLPIFCFHQSSLHQIFPCAFRYFYSTNQASTKFSKAPTDTLLKPIKPPPNFSMQLSIFHFHQTSLCRESNLCPPEDGHDTVSTIPSSTFCHSWSLSCKC